MRTGIGSVDDSERIRLRQIPADGVHDPSPPSVESVVVRQAQRRGRDHPFGEDRQRDMVKENAAEDGISASTRLVTWKMTLPVVFQTQYCPLPNDEIVLVSSIALVLPSSTWICSDRGP